MPSTQTWVKAIVGGAVMCIGGPALVMYVTPTEEEIFKRYNPDLQKKALANREKRQQEFDEFTAHLKELSKSDKPIWIAQKEWDAKRAEEAAKAKRDDYDAYIAEQRRRQAEVRGSAQ